MGRLNAPGPSFGGGVGFVHVGSVRPAASIIARPPSSEVWEEPVLAPEPPLVPGLPEDAPEAPEVAPLVPSPEAAPVAAPAETPEAATTPLVVPPLVTPLALTPAVACVPELAAADPEPFVPEPPPWMGELELPQLSAASANKAPRASTRARA